MSKLNIAIDANEANVIHRVGSNVYAFEVIKQLANLIKADPNLKATVLLSTPPLSDLPNQTQDWHYQIVKPAKFWTQLAAPLHLFNNKNKYDVFFTPGHYAPRLCAVPYVSSVMDLAYLHFPEQFRSSDLLQLKNWTAYSVEHAQKVITISQFTKQETAYQYSKPETDIVVAYPSASLPQNSASQSEIEHFFNYHGIENDYFLFIGTIQPRKNLVNLIKAFEIFCLEEQEQDNPADLPQLVIAGKIGWLAEPILEIASQSGVKDKIVFTGFVSDAMKQPLYKRALTTVLIGLYEGFGIPPLESMHVGTLPIVSHNSSLPEVVGEAGLQVNPYKPEIIAEALREVWLMPAKEKAIYRKKMRQQIQQFSWEKSGQIILDTLLQVAKSDTK
jgi:glycosyltransferase involved in cell wall biosynthesis